MSDEKKPLSELWDKTVTPTDMLWFLVIIMLLAAFGRCLVLWEQHHFWPW